MSDNPIEKKGFLCEREIMEWEPKSAVERLETLGNIVKANGRDFARELFIAHEALARRGGDRRSEDADTYSFSDFLNDAKVSRKTAYFYLKCYDPVENRLLDPEEVSSPKPQKLQAEDKAEFERMVVYAMESGVRLQGWSPEHEREYRRRAENERVKTLLEHWGTKRIKTSYDKGRDYFGDAIKNARRYIKVPLTRDLQTSQFEVCQHIEDFLSAIDDPGVRMSVAYGLGLKIRWLINELAAADAESQSLDIADGMEANA